MTPDFTILLVDDSANDTYLMRVAFQRAGLRQPLQCACDGEDAVAYLLGAGRYGDRTQFPLPAVLMMDLNMPGRNGFEVLEWIRRQPVLKRLQVYILSASSRSEDIDRAYDLGANSYLVKPGNLDGLEQMARVLGGWFELSHFATAHETDESRGITPVVNGRAHRPDAPAPARDSFGPRRLPE